MARNITKRQMIVNGILYPDDKNKLSSMINESLSDCTNTEVDSPFAIITPYASYKLALKAYASAYSQIIGEKYDTIIILAPIHKIAFSGIALTKSDSFLSPFGELSIDKKANEFLNKYNKEFFVYSEQYHLSEHSIEMQLPFISMIFKEDVKILPLIIGEGNTKFTMLLSRAINSLMEKKKGKYLIIATTNLSCEVKYKDAIVYDGKFANILSKNNPDQLAEQLAINQIKAHGGGGAVALLRLAQLSKINNIKILKLFNSGDINGEKLKVQGYISAVMW